MLTRFDRKSATDVSRKKGTDLGEFGKKWKMRQRPKCFVFWSGRWESNCIPNPKGLCFDGVAAPFRFKWSQVESNSLCWLGSVAWPAGEWVGRLGVESKAPAPGRPPQ